jgi:signal transduction histidine kinase
VRTVVERTAELQQTNEDLAEQVAERKRVEEALREEHRRLQQMLALHEKERRLVAYEIHDGFVQQVVGAQLLVQAACAKLVSEPARARETLESIVRLLTESIADARRLIGGLRPPLLDDAGVIAAIDYLVEETERRGGPAVEFVHDVRFERLAPPLETAIFRIVQESLTNARRHSGSHRVRVELKQQGDRLRIEVRDWGGGFDRTQIPPDHYGLEGICERARLFGGKAAIDAAPGKGTTILAELALADET